MLEPVWGCFGGGAMRQGFRGGGAEGVFGGGGGFGAAAARLRARPRGQPAFPTRLLGSQHTSTRAIHANAKVRVLNPVRRAAPRRASPRTAAREHAGHAVDEASLVRDKHADHVLLLARVQHLRLRDVHVVVLLLGGEERRGGERQARGRGRRRPRRTGDRGGGGRGSGGPCARAPHLRHADGLRGGPGLCVGSGAGAEGVFGRRDLWAGGLWAPLAAPCIAPGCGGIALHSARCPGGWEPPCGGPVQQQCAAGCAGPLCCRCCPASPRPGALACEAPCRPPNERKQGLAHKVSAI